MDHSVMNHSGMGHGGMDHSMMDHGAMDHSTMDHSAHAGHDSHGAHGMPNGCSPGHSMVFHTGVCQEILFSWWVTQSSFQLAMSALAILIAALVYEGLKYYREELHAKAYRAARDSQLNIAKTGCSGGPCGGTVVFKYSMWSSGHIWQTVLHAAQAGASYLLMLVFMTYNTWLCIALVLGLALGYFCFGWRKATVVDVTEHCQ